MKLITREQQYQLLANGVAQLASGGELDHRPIVKLLHLTRQPPGC